jgi:hypothetical protein
MMRARNRWVPLFRALSVAALGTVWVLACGGPQEQGGPGSVCFRTDDCKNGLACVPTAKGSTKSVCGSDLSTIVSMVDGAPAEAAAPTGDAASGAGGMPAAGGAAGKAGAAGSGGKPATGGAAGAAGSGSAGKSSGGASAGGAAAGGASAGGAPAGGMGGSGTGGSATSGGSSTGGGGSGGSPPADAGDG